MLATLASRVEKLTLNKLGRPRNVAYSLVSDKTESICVLYEFAMLLTKENYRLSIHLCIYGSTALYWSLAAFSVSWPFTQSVGLLGRGISPLHGCYLHTQDSTNRINAHKCPSLIWNSNPRSQRLRAKTVHALDRTTTVIGNKRKSECFTQ
jgi:hypothetical protein